MSVGSHLISWVNFFGYKSFLINSINLDEMYCLYLYFLISVVISICFCSSISYAQSVGEFNTTMYTTCGVLGMCLLLLCYSLSRQPQSSNQPTFHVNIIMTCVFNLCSFYVSINEKKYD